VTEIFAKFGIPITITYLIKIAGLDEDKIYSVLDKRLKTLSIGMNGNQLIMERIFKSSIMSSPYPEGFIALDWRERYNSFTANYYLEAWWRDEDYRGDPQEKYDVLLGGK
jgi:hypothetical protein